MDSSFLMCDSTEGDGKAEIVMDYVMSWCLRHAIEEFKESKPILSRYCRYMLHKLLQLESPLEQIVFIKVEVWKEWQHMDLCAEVKLINKGKEEFYALLIENKYYTPLHLKRDSKGVWRNQVDVYREIFEQHYDSIPSKKGWGRRYALVSCFDSEDKKIQMFDEAKEYGFEVFGFYDIIDENKENGKYVDSESEIFNEFWLRKW